MFISLYIWLLILLFLHLRYQGEKAIVFGIKKKKKKSIHISINSIHKLMGWFALQMLLSAEMYWMLSILSPFLQSVGKSMHAAIICLGIQTDSFTSTIIHSSGRSLIPFGQYNTKRLFCNFLVVFAYYYRK